MKRPAATLIMLGIIALSLYCADSATEISGTLPVVTGITVDSAASSGDTVIVTWTPVDSTLIEGYYLWTRTGYENTWVLVEAVDQNAGMHIASQSAYYTVIAYNGNNTSSDTGISDNTRTEMLSEIREVFSITPVGLRIDSDGDSLISGDPGSPRFHQHFTVAINPFNATKHVYSGTARPLQWPGGAETSLSSEGGYVAPAPHDSILWEDSISYGGSFFIALDDGYYCLLEGSSIIPDTLLRSDTLIISGQIQPVRGLRVFNCCE